MNENKRGFLKSDLARIEVFLDSVQRGEGTAIDPRQKTKGGFFPGLTAKPWHEADDFPSTLAITRILESDAQVIIEEYKEASTEPGFLIAHPASYLHPTLKAAAWGYHQVWRGGAFNPSAKERLPRICEVLAKIEEFLSPAGEVAFHNMVPQARLRPHADGPNTTLTCHLGIVVPPKCILRVAGESRTWQSGRCLWFDHSYEHDAWNESDENRVIMLLDIIHPDLTSEEVRYWRERYAASQAPVY